MHLDSAFRSLLASRAELQQLTPEQKAHLRLALEATFTNMSQTPDYKHNLSLHGLSINQFRIRGVVSRRGAFCIPFPFISIGSNTVMRLRRFIKNSSMKVGLTGKALLHGPVWKRCDFQVARREEGGLRDLVTLSI